MRCLIERFTYRKTNCFAIRGREPEALAVEAGWPGTRFEYARELKKTGNALERITWAMVTHFHLDHAGLFGEFAATGIHCVVFENQEDAIGTMEKTIRTPPGPYVAIDRSRLVRLETASSKEWLASLGIAGEVLRAPGHSPDGVVLVLDNGETIIGDLFPETLLMPGDAQSAESWAAIRAKGAKRIYPGHAPAYDLTR